MSEEEIIQSINNVLKYKSEINLAPFKITVVEGLLDLYNKEKEKNKEARDRIEHYLLNNMAVENNPDRIEEELIKLQKKLEEDNKQI